MTSTANSASSYSWKWLHAADFGFNQPFQLPLRDGKTLDVEKVMRIVPKRRMVTVAKWQGKLVIAKLFYSRHSQRNVRKELQGIRVLENNHVPTPKLLYQTQSEDARVDILLFEFISPGETLDAMWQRRVDERALMPLLEKMVVEIATHHVFGVAQQDMHLKNFIVTDKSIFTLDGAAVSVHDDLLPRKESLDNLALFLSQLGAGESLMQKHLFDHYAKQRGWALKPSDWNEMRFLIRQHQQARWRRYENKIFRSCTQFVRVRNWVWSGMVEREYATDTMRACLLTPHKFFELPNKEYLKQGRSSTVIRVTFEGHTLVIKRYNMKNAIHRTRRLLRATRAACAWRLAHKLRLFCVATAKPIAYVEQNIAGIHGESYYITEYVSKQNIQDYLNTHQDAASSKRMSLLIARLFRALKDLSISHGDLKATNILLDENKQPVLIDLDGAAEHVSSSGLHAAWRKETKRFLENFAETPELRDSFAAQLD